MRLASPIAGMKTSTGSLSFAGSVKPATGSGSYRVSQEEGWQRNEHKKLGKRKRAAFMLCKHQQVKFPRGQVQFVDTKRFSFHNTTSATSVFTKKTCGFCAHSGILFVAIQYVSTRQKLNWSSSSYYKRPNRQWREVKNAWRKIFCTKYPPFWFVLQCVVPASRWA